MGLLTRPTVTLSGNDSASKLSVTDNVFSVSLYISSRGRVYRHKESSISTAPPQHLMPPPISLLSMAPCSREQSMSQFLSLMSSYGAPSPSVCKKQNKSRVHFELPSPTQQSPTSTPPNLRPHVDQPNSKDPFSELTLCQRD